LARSALRSALSEQVPSAAERRILDNVAKRVQLWDDVKSYYPDSGGVPRSIQSRTTEAVFNALILATYDRPAGALGDRAQSALKNMWALQEKTGEKAGGFPWLNFSNEPWEAEDSPYFGAAVAAIAVGATPASYRSAPDVESNISLLEGYLRREFQKQSEINRAYGVWASGLLPQALSSEQKRSFREDLFRKQLDDGGWSLSTLIGSWKRRDRTSLPSASDGYATALITYALEQAGTPREQLKKPLEWLRRNQTQDGFWPAYSPNLQRDPASDAGRFMSDAATSLAVLALTDKP
jgi:hypothetical protein